MTLPGGPADKLGNRYEKLWTLSEFVRMLRGETETIRIEDPNTEKAEFVVTTGSRQESHQAKRSHPNGKWSFAELRKDGLLQAIGEQLAGNDNQFVFVSGSEARDLSELCEAARNAESLKEFKDVFLKAETRRNNFKKLLGFWACDVSTAFECLQRINVETIGEHQLKEKVLSGLQALFLASPNEVMEALRGIAEDSVHCTITRQSLIENLAGRGYQMRRIQNPKQASIAVRTATDEWYLYGVRSKLIQQPPVPRSATEDLLSRLQDTPTESVITGRAGSGKTACVIEAVDSLRKRDIPVLAFRLDRFLTTLTTTELGERLGLEESPVLVLAAAAESADRPGVLIVDQLDAVSTMSGRTSGAFDLVERLLLEAREMRATIHTIVVCRVFDWENDPRLRKLMPPDSQAQVDVGDFEVAEVEKILAKAGFNTALFQQPQLELLRLPQNLSLFLESGFDVSSTPTFGTAKDIFDEYWNKKRKSVADRVAPSPARWMEVMETLCDEMTSTQQLSVPKEKLDSFASDYVDSLASEGVVTFDGRRYGFGHESFFDYCFARVFINRSETVVSFLKGSEQHLFRRAQVRQVLTYLRDADPGRYVTELRNLLSDKDIRPHIKDIAFALLAEVTNPTEEEWTIWEEWTAPALNAVREGTPNSDKLSAIAWQRFSVSSSWFTFADERGEIENWLVSGNDRLIDAAVNYLKNHQRHSPDRVVALLKPYADLGGQWVPRLQSIMGWVRHHTSRDSFDFFLELLENGTLDQLDESTAVRTVFWSMPRDLIKHRPEWVPEVLAHWLRWRLAIIHATGEDLGRIEIFGYDFTAAEMFDKSAESVPAVFVERLLPVVLEISDSTLIEISDSTLINDNAKPPKLDAVWTYLRKTPHSSVKDVCLSGLAGALAALAREDSTGLREVIADLRQRDTHIANHLLLALYTGGAAHYADEAVSLLCDEPWRFRCGFMDSTYWCAREMIQAVVPHCTAEYRGKLESVILDYVPPYELTEDGYRETGWGRFALLSEIPTELRSVRANAHFRELERKFGKPEGEPIESTAEYTEPPIEKEATDKMTDDQWLLAIAKHHSDNRTDLINSGDGLKVKGGASELAQVLEQRVKEEPKRFGLLSLEFPVDTNPLYLEHTLAGLKDAIVSADLKLQVCRKAFTDSPRKYGKSITDVLGAIKDPLPDDAIDMLHRLATEHEDPATEGWQEDAGGGRTYYNGDIHFNGINTTRGRAADAIRDLIITDSDYIERFRTTLELMVKDSSVSVLSCVAETLRGVAYHDHDPALGMSLFLSMVSSLSENRLLATPHVYFFIRDNLSDSFADLRPIIERMLRSSAPKVPEVGARLACIAALRHEERAADLADEARRGNARHRLGVAQVASANITTPDYRDWCEARLVVLFNDEDEEVRREAASCFRKLRDKPLDRYKNLIMAFSDSKAYQEGAHSILSTLERSPRRLPGVTCMVCEKFFDRFSKEAKDIRTGRIADTDTDTIVKLIFRTYQQHQDDEWTSRSLDLIDRLCLEEVHAAEHEFEQFER